MFLLVIYLYKKQVLPDSRTIIQHTNKTDKNKEVHYQHNNAHIIRNTENSYMDKYLTKKIDITVH
jgi:hypothetical protein